MSDIGKILHSISQEDNTYEYRDLGVHHRIHLYVVVRRITTPEETKGNRLFEVNINVDYSQKILQIIVPIFEEGLYGEDIGTFYQFLSELNAQINGHARIAVYPFDRSNQPVIILQESLNGMNKKRLKQHLEYLLDLYLSIHPVLDYAIAKLRLNFDPRARSKSPQSSLIDSFKRLL